MGLGFLVHLLGLHPLALIAGQKAPANPWGGLTFEWETESPPIEHNFHHEPLVQHGPYDFETVVPPHCDRRGLPAPPRREPDSTPRTISHANRPSPSGAHSKELTHDATIDTSNQRRRM